MKDPKSPSQGVPSIGTNAPNPGTADPNVMPDITGPGGRDTLYKTEYDQMLVDHMASGLSFESFAGVVDVSTNTIKDWTAANASFLAAKQRGVAKSRIFWEKLGVAYIVEGRTQEIELNGKKVKQKRTEKLNSNVYRLNMINRFGWKNSGSEESDGAAVSVNIHASVMAALDARDKKGEE